MNSIVETTLNSIVSTTVVELVDEMDNILDFDFDFSDEREFGTPAESCSWDTIQEVTNFIGIELSKEIVEFLDEVPELLDEVSFVNKSCDHDMEKVIPNSSIETALPTISVHESIRPTKRANLPQSKATVKTGVSRKKKILKQKMIKSTPNQKSHILQSAPLIAAPLLDKGESLVFFPNAFARFTNIGDMSGLASLLDRHASPNCEVMFKGFNLTISSFISLKELFNDLHPDTANYVYSTRVVNNTVVAALYTKFTDSDTIFKSVAPSRSNSPVFKALFGDYKTSTRLKRWQKKIRPLTTKSESEKLQMISAAETPYDLVAYANYYMKLTFDDVTQKIIRFDYEFELTSLTSVGRST